MTTVYVRRIMLMLLFVLPLTAVGVALFEWAREDVAEPLPSVLGGAFFLVYVWGAITAVAVSIVHTAIVQRFGGSAVVWSVIAGGLLGVIAGALTPTFVTGVPNLNSALVGALAGIVYGFLAFTWVSQPQSA